jgi:putative ABC transport system ATP-binding protein
MQKTSDPIIEVHNLSKKVREGSGELTILEHIDLSVAYGSSIAIVGASGSGKSTLLGLLAGLDTATAGSVRVFGQDLGTLDEDARAALRRGRVGFVFQSFQLMPHLSALENVMLPLELHGAATWPGTNAASASGSANCANSASDPASTSRTNHAAPMNRQSVREHARQLLGRVGLAERIDHYPRLLSGGEQQRVALARAFATGPQLLFADEPTGSLDAANGQAVIDMMFELNRESGATLVLVTHDIALARRCEFTATIEAGRLVQPVHP